MGPAPRAGPRPAPRLDRPHAPAIRRHPALLQPGDLDRESHHRSIAGVRVRRPGRLAGRRLRGRVRRGVRADLAACRSRPPRPGRGPRHLRAGLAGRLLAARSPAAGYRAADPHRAGRMVALRPDPPRRRRGAPSRAAGEATPGDPQAAAAAPAGPVRNSSCASWGRTGSRSPRPSSSWVPIRSRPPNRSARASSSGSNSTGSSWRRTPRGGSWSSFPRPPNVSTCSSRSRAMAPTGRGGRPRPTTSRSRPASPPSWRRPGRWGGSSSTPTASRSQAWRSVPASNSRSDPAKPGKWAAARG